MDERLNLFMYLFILLPSSTTQNLPIHFQTVIPLQRKEEIKYFIPQSIAYAL